MTCYGCSVPLKDGGWFFTDAPPGRKMALCEPCHQDSVPSKHRREWQSFHNPRFVGQSFKRSGRVNVKSPG